MLALRSVDRKPLPTFKTGNYLTAGRPPDYHELPIQTRRVFPITHASQIVTSKNDRTAQRHGFYHQISPSMWLNMAHSESPPGSSPPEDADLSLPDAPPLKVEESDKASNANGGIDLDNLFDADSADEDALNLSSSAAAPTSSNNNNNNNNNNIPSSSSSSSATLPHPAAAVPQSKTKQIDPQLMTQYYSRLFPFRTLFHWLNHSLKPCPDFSNREFAFTLSNDAYLRYQSFATADVLRRDVLRLNPSRFEIGPVYTANPRDRKTLRASTAFKPLAKELVFDIDLTDYDDVRTCCAKADICSRCWRFVTVAIKVVDAALRQDFGFEHIMWVYSGRRGAHAWVSDRVAREMDDDRRRAIAAYLEVVKGGAGGAKRVNVKRPLHPHLTRSLDILKPYFQSAVLEEQNPFASSSADKPNDSRSERLLSLLPQDQTFLSSLRAKWSSDPHRSSTKKWSDIDTVASTGISPGLSTRALRDAKQDILLEYTYPRLDVEVSKKRIHLLKAPFVVHPATGRVCVPITSNAETRSADEVDRFQPENVPTVAALLAEVDGHDDGSNKTDGDGDGDGDHIMHGFVAEGGAGQVRKLSDWEKTGLKAYIEIFDHFVKTLLRAEARGKRERDREEEGGGPVLESGMDF